MTPSVSVLSNITRSIRGEPAAVHQVDVGDPELLDRPRVVSTGSAVSEGEVFPLMKLTAELREEGLGSRGIGIAWSERSKRTRGSHAHDRRDTDDDPDVGRASLLARSVSKAMVTTSRRSQSKHRSVTPRERFELQGGGTEEIADNSKF
jgi:hypothetical protein